MFVRFLFAFYGTFLGVSSVSWLRHTKHGMCVTLKSNDGFHRMIVVLCSLWVV